MTLMVKSVNNSTTSANTSASDGTRSVPATLPLDAAATLACIYEVTARKPGNVHPTASFDDVTTYAAFVASAVAIGPVIARVVNTERGVGQVVLDAVRETRKAVQTNTNLGTLLLIAPLAAVPPGESFGDGIHEVLQSLS